MIPSLFDFIFPPLCLACRERCSTKYLCPDCWLLCELPDPAGRCRHCFEELDQRGTMCAQCRQGSLLTAVRATVFDSESPAHLLGIEAVDAMAGFAFLQWVQLEWPLPDAVIPMPDSVDLAKAFAHLVDRPFVRALSSGYEYREKGLEEEANLLLIDFSNPVEMLQKATEALCEAFPKRVYLLTLFPYAFYPP